MNCHVVIVLSIITVPLQHAGCMHECILENKFDVGICLNRQLLYLFYFYLRGPNINRKCFKCLGLLDFDWSGCLLKAGYSFPNILILLKTIKY